MPKRHSTGREMRLRVAQEAARLIADHGINDYYLAKTKAAAALGVVDKGALPNNREIEEALKTAVRLFGGDEHVQRLARMRDCAVGVMQALSEFSPRAVGAVVSGALGANSDVELHLFSEPAEMVAMALLEAAPDVVVAETRVRFTATHEEIYPANRFDVDGVTVDATVFPIDGQRQAPLSPVTGRPMKRLSANALSALDEDAQSAQI
jgi:predicted nucleotidyltransferase